MALSFIFLGAMLALAIDIGMMAVAKTDAQNAADLAALTGARTLNGDVAEAYRKSFAIADAQNAAKANKVMNMPIVDSMLPSETGPGAKMTGGVTVGVYSYDTATNSFVTTWKPVSGTLATGESWGAIRMTINATIPTVFAKILWSQSAGFGGPSSLSVSASAAAVHKPRDIAIILDFSGSMKFSSRFSMYPKSNPPSTSNLRLRVSMSGDTRYPRFGPWARFPMNTNDTPENPMRRADLLIDDGPGRSGEIMSVNNLTEPYTTTPPGQQLVNNFFTTQGSGSPVLAFTNTSTFAITNTPVCTPAPASFSSQEGSTFEGDKFPLRHGESEPITSINEYATNVRQMFQDSVLQTAGLVYSGSPLSLVTTHIRYPLWETNGYGPSFRGYTMGPGYYGKTFYMWPPDPRAPVGDPGAPGYVPGDWRRRYFRTPGPNSTTPGAPVDDNAVLWNPSGTWKLMNNTNERPFIVNYNAIMKWLRQSPRVFPQNGVFAGRIRYYTSMPDLPDSIINQVTGQIQGSANPDQRFWKEYIDYVLGVNRYRIDYELYGYDTNNNSYTPSGGSYGTPRITPKSSLNTSIHLRPYMHYEDNPVHPRLHMWFGPLTMLGFFMREYGRTSSNTFGNYNWSPGTCYEAQNWQLKAAIQSALGDIKKNHPNDMATSIYFSSDGAFARAIVEMTNTKFPQMIAKLWYPNHLVSDAIDSATGLAVLHSGFVRPYAATFGDAPFNEQLPGGVWWVDIPSRSPSVHGRDIPNAKGGTGPDLAFRAAFNQFSSAASSNIGSGHDPGAIGGRFFGRRGATKVVIFETDGVPNYYCQNGSPPTTNDNINQDFQNNGPFLSYYRNMSNRPMTNDGVSQSHAHTLTDAVTYGSYKPMSHCLFVIRQLCAFDVPVDPNTGMASGSSTFYAKRNMRFADTAFQNVIFPGYSTGRSPVQVHSIAFGDLFEPSLAADPSSLGAKQQVSALHFLKEVERCAGSIRDPINTISNIDPSKIIVGDYATRIENLRTCFERIMQGGNALALVE